MDWPLVISATILIGLGLFTLYSASAVQAGHRDFLKQATWVFIALPVFGLFLFMDPRVWGHYRPLLYGLNVFLLIAVFLPILGHAAKGSQRWVDIGPFQLQPSEPAKLLLVLTLADYLARRRESLRTLKGLCFSFLHVLPLFVLVYRQPDLGTSLVFICIWIGMSLVAGQRLRLLFLAFVTGVALFALAWNSPLIRDYQKERVRSLFSGEGHYHTDVAAQAMGTGGLVGSGYLRGELKESRLVPEQTTDFIFTVIAEEGGFVASLGILALFAFFLWRVWLIVANARVRLFQYMAAGCFVVYSFHILVNLLMVVHLIPVVGVPLPFWSYGGSALVVNFAMLGLLINLRSREKHDVF